MDLLVGVEIVLGNSHNSLAHKNLPKMAEINVRDGYMLSECCLMRIMSLPSDLFIPGESRMDPVASRSFSIRLREGSRSITARFSF